MNSPPDLRQTFRAISQQMRAEFERTEGIRHAGGRGAGRELALSALLQKYLPAKFGVGRGQVAHWSNLLSRECDLVVYDHLNTPRLMPDSHHSIFPAESVFAAIEVKSVLTADELRDAFDKARSAYLATLDPEHYPEPVHPRRQGLFTAIFSYRADRSLDAIAQQVVREWPDPNGRFFQPAPLIVVLEEGTVELGMGVPARDLVRIRRTKELTLLRFFMQLLSEVQVLELPAFRLKRYLQMPELFEGHRVRQNMNYLQFFPTDTQRRIGVSGLRKILAFCSSQEPIPYAQYCSERIGIPLDDTEGAESRQPTFEYNPRGFALKPERGVAWLQGARGPFALVQIDGANYIVDKAALDPEDFESPPDPELDEVF